MSTDLQHRVFEFVRDRIVGDLSPTIREIADRFDISDSQARSTVEALIRQKRLARPPGQHRALAVVGATDLRAATSDALRAELARRGVTMDALETPRVLHQGRYCAANGCDVQVQPGFLMCREHWFGVEQRTKSAIFNAFRARHPQAYQEAVEAARDQVSGFAQVAERVY